MATEQAWYSPFGHVRYSIYKHLIRNWPVLLYCTLTLLLPMPEQKNETQPNTNYHPITAALSELNLTTCHSQLRSYQRFNTFSAIHLMPKSLNLNRFMRLKNVLPSTFNDQSNYVTEYWTQQTYFTDIVVCKYTQKCMFWVTVTSRVC
jgi:hypothetical protein